MRKLFAFLAATPLIAAPRLTGALDRGLAFEQTIGKDRFIWHGPGFSVELGRGEVRMAAGGDVVAMRLAGARKHTIPRAAEPPSAQINYLVGPSSQWRRGIKAYSKVAYPGVYKGIDLVFYGRDGRLEHDFVVHPGGDPNSIQLRWAGATHLALNARGDLSVYTGTGDIRWSAPVVYQSVNGVHTQVDGEFRLLGGDRVGFRVGAYDPNAELVIDPALIFSTYLGGSRNDASRGVAVDASGNVYVTGQSNSLDFPVTPGGFQTAFGGGTTGVVAGDVFVAKYNSSGKLVYATYIGGRRDDIGMAIAVDSSGSAYVTGYTNSGDFPTTPGAIQTAFGGYLGASFIITQGDAFVAKLSPDGTSLVYSTYLGGNNDDAAFGIALDKAGNAYIAGTTQSRNFPVTNGAYQTGYAGSGAQSEFNAFGYAIVAGDAFLAKINASGSALVYCTLLGGPYDDVATSVAVDTSGNAYIGGYTLGLFPTTGGAFQTKFGGTDPQNYFFNFGDGFLAKFDPMGANLLYSTYVGGKGDDWVSGIVVDPAGNLYATGGTSSPNFPTTMGAIQKIYSGPTNLGEFIDVLFGDAFLVKLNPSGSALVFGTYVGGTGDDVAMAIALDPGGNVVMTGFTNSPDFPVSASAIQTANHGPGPQPDYNSFGDAFVAQFTAAGALLYATYLGGTGQEMGTSIAIGSSGAAAITGLTNSSDFPVLNAAQAKSGDPGSFYSGTPSFNAASLRGNAFVTTISGFGASSGPSLISVLSATGEAAAIAQNTWVEIKGSNLAPDTRQWQASDFVNGQMPTQLDGVSAKVNGKPAFVYYISNSQVNVLTPLDSTIGPVQVLLTNGQATSLPLSVAMQAYAPGFFQFSPSPYVAATHADGSLIGPASLYPGLSTPAKPNEVVVLYTNGFGQTINNPVVNGSASVSGTLPVAPVVIVGGIQAVVQFAGIIAPGEYQFNVVIPGSLPDGDATIQAEYNGFSTQSGAKITIQH